MKSGDLVMLKNLHPSWGCVAVITSVRQTDYGTGQIYLISRNNISAIPWLKRHRYLEVIRAS